MWLGYAWYATFVINNFTHCIPTTGWVPEITFQLDTDPATDPPVFTLTCTSTGGPSTTVSWRRDGILLSDDSTYNITSQILVNLITDTYNHTLTVTGRLLGVYQCNVDNNWRAHRSLAVGTIYLKFSMARA